MSIKSINPAQMFKFENSVLYSLLKITKEGQMQKKYQFYKEFQLANQLSKYHHYPANCLKILSAYCITPTSNHNILKYIFKRVKRLSTFSYHAMATGLYNKFLFSQAQRLKWLQMLFLNIRQMEETNVININLVNLIKNAKYLKVFQLILYRIPNTEILSQVLKRLSSKKSLKSLQIQSLMSASLIKNVLFDGISSIILNNSSLKKLDFVIDRFDPKIQKDSLLQFFDSFNNGKAKLDILNLKIMDINFKIYEICFEDIELFLALQGQNRLKFLKLELNNIMFQKPAKFDGLIYSLSQMVNLKSLSIYTHDMTIVDGLLYNLFEAIRSLANLESLNIDIFRGSIDEWQIKDVGLALSQIVKIRVLKLQFKFVNINDSQLTNLFKYIDKLVQLEELQVLLFHSKNITTQGLNSYIDHLYSLSCCKLKTLHLDFQGSNLDLKGLQKVLTFPGYSKCIQYLTLNIQETKDIDEQWLQEINNYFFKLSNIMKEIIIRFSMPKKYDEQTAKFVKSFNQQRDTNIKLRASDRRNFGQSFTFIEFICKKNCFS